MFTSYALAVIVDFLAEVATEYRLDAITLHVAVRYLDRILGTSDVAKSQLQLVAICCLLAAGTWLAICHATISSHAGRFAAKYEEPESKVPPVEGLNECSNHAYTSSMIHQMEVRVLNALQWRLGVITPLHFLLYYVDEGVVCPGDLIENRPCSDKMLRYTIQYCRFFCDLCLQGTFRCRLPFGNSSLTRCLNLQSTLFNSTRPPSLRPQ